jgi:protease-4
MDPAKVRQLADGRPYTGQQALQLRLIDAIGSEADARAWLATKGVPTSLPVERISTQGLVGRAVEGSLAPVFDTFWKSLTTQWLTLDAVSLIWQRSGH